VERGRRFLWLLVALVPVVATGTFLWMKIAPRNKPSPWLHKQRSRARLQCSLCDYRRKYDDIYLGLGISDAVTTKLGTRGKLSFDRPAPWRGTSELHVIPRLPGGTKGDAVLDGRIQRSGDAYG